MSTYLRYGTTPHCNASLPIQVTAKKLDVNDRDFDSDTALHFAAGQGHTEVVEWLLQHGGKMTRDSTGGTLLHTAAEQGNIEV